MNTQPVVHSRSSANGFGCRKADREFVSRLDNKSQAGKINSNKLISTGPLTANKGAGYESPSRERLFYLSTCLIGHPVEVQVLDGAVFSGIFHAMNFDKDSGIILKMARLLKPGSSRGHKNMSDSVSKPPSKTLIIQSKELVQVIAKGVSVSRDELTNEIQREKHQEIMTDSSISQSRRVEMERELERWVPDDDNPECPELENIFDGPWNRGWDQFEANETLFGVKSTFNEELYTTKLQRGPQTRELEREASRIAREIEGEDTQDLHLAEERGIQFHDHFEIDEETRFSSVFRRVDDSGLDDTEDILLDSRNIDTFGGLSGSITNKSFTDFTSGKNNNEAKATSSSSSVDEVQSSQSSICRDPYHSGYGNLATQPSSECVSKSISAWHVESRMQDNQLSDQCDGSTCSKVEGEKQKLGEEAQILKSEDSESSLSTKKENDDKVGLSPNATAYAPSSVAPKDREMGSSPCEPPEGSASVKTQGTPQAVNPRVRPGSSASSTSDYGGAASASSGPGLSPSSSVGSLSSEKSTLNPHAKEFKLNPNAKSFVPSQTSLRPASPVSDSSFYYPTSMAAVPHMHGLPVSFGTGPTYSGHQPVMFNPQAAPLQSPQAYFPTNGPQYGPQMILGHPRQVVYMPTYPPDMPYKGREY